MRNFIFILMAVALVGCKKTTRTTATTTSSSFPDISTFVSTPSDQFFLDSIGMAKVSRAFPYKGTNSACAHEGGHLHFSNTGAPYSINVIAPAAGTIGRVDSCYMLPGSDKYEISLDFADTSGDTVSFSFSLEPQDGFPCSGGVSGSDNGYFTPYILVTEGQSVAKGDVIAYMYKSNSGNDAAHIHFNLTYGSKRNGFACPNIFTSTIESQFGALYGGETCSGSAMPSTFCYLPGTGEDLTGL